MTMRRVLTPGRRAGGLLVAAVILAAGGESRGAVPMFPNPYFDVGKQPVAVGLADFNGDGRLDIATANLASNDVSILLGEGDGGFRPQLRFPAGPTPVDLAIADFNRDGKPDLAVILEGGNEVAILIGTGDGSFASPGLFPAGVRPRGLAMGDFDADGNLDLAISDLSQPSLPGYVTVLLGTGDGGFAPAGTFGVGFAPEGVVAADFNGDGILDLAVAEFQSFGFTVHLGHGDGTFGPSAGGGVVVSPVKIAAADLNEDGLLDVVVTSQGSGTRVFLGDGHGGFLPGDALSGQFSRGVITDDFNHDGHLDIAASEQTNVTYVSLGLGDGHFGSPTIVGAGVDGGSVAAGDFNGDGVADLALPDEATQSVLIVLGLGDGRFGPQNRYAGGGSIFDIATGDFNCDGVRDLISPGPQGGVGIVFGRGDGSFGPLTLIPTPLYMPNAVAVGDFDRSHCDDFAFTTIPGNGIFVYLNRGDGTFLPPLHYQTMAQPVSIVAQDFNDDGILDLAAADQFSNEIQIRLGAGDGTFPEQRDTSTGATRPVWLVAGDLDGDDRPDLIYSQTGFTESFAALSLGDGRLAPGVALGTAGYVALADFDSDSILDLASSPDDVAIRRGNGDGSFGPPVHSGVFGFWLTPGDFDGDGHVDLVASQGNAIQVLLGDGRGGLRRGDRVWGGESSYASVADDFNGDGRLDLALAEGGFAVLLNRGVEVTNHTPVAAAGADARLECASPAGRIVRLDGSSSFDVDSAPGTHDDIVEFAWFENFDRPGQALLGTGRILDTTLSLGSHVLTLRVTDRSGASGLDDVVITIVDTTPPSLTLRIDPAVLWPPNHRMVRVAVAATAADSCGAATITLDSVISSEPDDAPGAGDGHTVGDVQGAETGTFDLAFDLRAERSDAGAGRIYTVYYSASDASGNRTSASTPVMVPHDRSGLSDPIVLRVVERDVGTLLDWDDVQDATAFNVARGDVGALSTTPNAIVLGPLTCLAASTTVTDTSGLEDNVSPALGTAFFYVVEYADESWTSYGTADAGLPAVTFPGQPGCP